MCAKVDPHRQTPTDPVDPSLRLDTLSIEYLASLERRRLSPNTCRVQGEAVREFVRFLARRGRRDLSRVRARDVVLFQVHLTRRLVRHGRRVGLPLHPTTVSGMMSGVRGFTRWLVKTQRSLLDLSRELPVIHVPQTVPRVLSFIEMTQLLSFPFPDTPIGLRDLAIVELLYSAGLRASELAGLDLADLDLAGGEVFLKRTKGGRSRRVPIGTPALRAIVAYLAYGRDLLRTNSTHDVQSQAVFLKRTGGRLTRIAVSAMIKLRSRKIGLDRVSAHTLRHTAAVHMLKRGADIRHIQEFLGHVEVGTTARYTRLVLSDLKETLVRCHPRNRLELEA